MINLRCACAALMLAAALIFGKPAAGLAITGTPFSTCGTLSTAGLFDLTADLANLQGDCIAVTGANVVLNLKGHSITGGQLGVGLKIAASATNFILNGGGATISHFAIGMEVDAPGAWAGNFNVTSCASGLLLKGASNSIIYHYSSSNNFGDGTDVVATTGAELLNATTNNNQPNGVLFAGSSHNVLDFFISRFNSESNVRVAPLPPPPGVRGKATPSTFNVLVDSALKGSNLSVLIDKTSSSNIISEMGTDAVQHATSLDLFDQNAGCDHNLWFLNGFIKAKPSCAEGPK